MSAPPRLARAALALIGRLVPARLSDDVMGGLEERWHADARSSRARAWGRLASGGVSVIWRCALDRRRAGEPRGLRGGWRQDVRYAWRALRAAPGISALVIVTMALGVGANTAVFSAVYGIVLKPLPYRASDRLVLLTGVHPERDAGLHSSTLEDFRDWKDSARSFESMALFSYWTFNVTGADLPLRVIGGRVTPEFFELLGTPPLIGRTLGPADEAQGAADRVVISHAFWRRAFNADPHVAGRTLSFNGVPSEIVGVMPPAFRFPAGDVDIWAPLGRELDTVPRRSRFMLTVARLAPGVSLSSAQHEMDAISAALAARYPDSNRGWTVRVAGARESLVTEVRQPLLLLLLASGMVLAIACANLATLLLSRASARRRECAIRAALGASKLQLLRQFLVESVLLAAAGAAAGLAIAAWGIRALIRLQPADLPRVDEVGLHPMVLLFALGCTVAAGILFGIAPALHAASSTGRALRESSLTTTGGRAHSLRRAFVVIEIALACVLVVGGVLLLRSFGRVTALDPGFRPSGVAVVRVFLGPPNYRTFDQQNSYIARAVARLGALPSIRGVAAGTNLPLGDDVTREPVIVEGRPAAAGAPLRAELRAVTPGYFALLAVPFLEGRDVDARDTAAAPRVAVVNRALAAVLSPGASAVGTRLRWESGIRNQEWMTIVGVVDDVTGPTLEEPEGPVIYTPYEQRTMPFLRWATIAARTGADAGAAAEAMRRSLREVDADLPVFGVEPLDARFDRATAPRRFGLLMLGLFSGLALFIALAGVYGVVAFAVSERRREISLRLALGAEPHDVAGLILRDGGRLTLAGLSLGLIAAWAGGRRIESLLFGVSAHDAATFAVTALLIAAVAMAASAIPAWRSTRIAPSEVLRP
jgi:putative ABC transport system permease protein